MQGVERLSKGTHWTCCPFQGSKPTKLDETSAALAAAVKRAGAEVFAADISQAVQQGHGGRCQNVTVLIPELSEELGYCRWEGDGHFDMSSYKGEMPPTLGQIVTFLLEFERAAANGGWTFVVSSEARRKTGAVLVGAALMFIEGWTSKEAWQIIRDGSPPLDPDPAEAWDRFPTPFALDVTTHLDSSRVFDCLAGLEAARRLGWFPDFHHFDVQEWHLLRRKFDATWVIPNELLALAHPCVSCDNPAFPGLLPLLAERSFTGDSTARLSTHTGDSTDTSRGHLECDVNECDDCEEPDVAYEGGAGLLLEPMTPRRRPFLIYTLPQTSPTRPRKLSSEPDFKRMLSKQRSSSTERPLIAAKTKATECSTFAELFHQLGVGNVVQLNEAKEITPNRSYVDAFENAGFNCSSFAFKDMTFPSPELVKDFLALSTQARAQQQQAIAVHCKAGLGRTGVMMGSYAVQFYDISGSEFLGWVRLVRPGSVQNRAQEAFLRSLKPGMPYGKPEVNRYPTLKSGFTMPSCTVKRVQSQPLMIGPKAAVGPLPPLPSDGFLSSLLRPRFASWPLFG